ncbi:MAG: hypothetical protein K1X56_07115 [Flavobacteriales bacterium]|nr:hypothetical protein [Flavobacteriales bacterium]
MLIAIIFLWIGFVTAISFMEAWIKFLAPGVTLSVGLSIGRLVFRALNVVEWLFCFTLIGLHIFFLVNPEKRFLLLFLLCGIILVLQTLWLLPALDERALKWLRNENPGPSSLHRYYVLLEIIKLSLLIYAGVLACQH